MYVAYFADVIRPALLIQNSAKHGPGRVLGSGGADPRRCAVPARLGAASQQGRDMDSIDEVLGELPMPPYVTAEDVGFAVRAVTVHAAEQWPEGRAAGTTARRIRAGCIGGGGGCWTGAASATGRCRR
ncbi:hypothetical protein GCM10029963_35250 [Micromonospora andamanensis]